MKGYTYGEVNPNRAYAVMDAKKITTVRTVRQFHGDSSSWLSSREETLHPEVSRALKIIWKRESITMLLYQSIQHLIPSPGVELRKVQ